MAKTNRQEPRKTKKGESDAHKVRRSYKEQLDYLLDLDNEELEDYDLDLRVREGKHNGGNQKEPWPS